LEASLPEAFSASTTMPGVVGGDEEGVGRGRSPS
jgi:hypothetical protein